jgi:hypothetical protein
VSVFIGEKLAGALDDFAAEAVIAEDRIEMRDCPK